MMMDFLVERRHIQNVQFVQRDDAVSLTENQILCAVDHFAFTANNITYAASGEFLKYWNFFPVPEEGWGRVPVWGFADVIESQHPEIAVGERLYGYWPMSTHLVIQAGKVSESSFQDVVEHRQELNPVYNTYVRVAQAQGYDNESLNALLRPMFTTSFLLDDFADDNGYFGAETMLLSSASSKTGYGTAFLLHRNRVELGADYRIIGLTSPKNIDFVKSLGCYDEVLPYDGVTTLIPASALYLDFAGNGALRKTIHDHYGDLLKYDCAIGATNWDKMGSARDVEGVKPELFFAPAQIQKRMKDWGRDAYNERMTTSWLAFLEQSDSWVDVVSDKGEDAIEKIYKAMLVGEAPPHNGYMLSF